MAPPDTGAPCAPWTTDDDLPADCLDGSLDPEVVASAHRVATDRLWALTGRRFGASCPVALRPCSSVRCGPPDRHRGTWLPCDTPGTVIDLGVAVYDVVSVTIDGTPFTDFQVDDFRYVRRIDGDRWPYEQDLTLDAGQPGTFEITVRYGLAVPVGGVWAARALVCELLNARRPGKRCRLPERTRTASAQGTTIELDDLASILDEGLTGLTEVDQWIAEVNPHRLPSRSSVMSPDAYRRRPRRRTS